MAPSDETVIELSGVGKTYDMEAVKVEVLRGVDLKIRRGEFVAIVGASGSGKSTLLQIIGLLDRPTVGKVFVAGEDSGEMSDEEIAEMRGKKIGFVFQFFNLYPTLDALGNVELPMLINGVGAEERRSRARHLLKVVGLEDREKNMPSQLSGGQRQRVSIARALAMNPQIILADEPTGNLDSRTGKEVVDMLIDVSRKMGSTIIMITHDRHIAEHAERIIEIKDGMIVSDKQHRRIPDERKLH